MSAQQPNPKSAAFARLGSVRTLGPAAVVLVVTAEVTGTNFLYFENGLRRN